MKPTRLFDLPYYQLENYPQDGMFVTKTDGIWEKLSTKSFIDRVTIYSKALYAMNVKPGDTIGLVSSNRYEWNIMDIAIQQVGAIVVPLYPNISVHDYIYIFNDSKLKFCFVGNQELHDKINPILSQTPSVEKLFTFDNVAGANHWSTIEELGVSVSDSDIQARKDAIQNADLVTIIYTSGTTGNPKGVMLSHNNLLSNAEAAEYSIPADNHSRVLSFLPVCHVYERMLHYLYMKLGCSIHFAESMDTIGDNIREVKPMVFTAVPRLIEKVYDRIMAKGDELTGIKRKLFFWAVVVAEEYELSGKSLGYKIKLAVARKLIFSKWREALGGHVKAIASGSAALQPRLARVFYAAQIPILEGYGLTETSPVISVNCFKRGIRFGSVGPLIEDVQVKIAEDGEILTKGPNLMLGYYNLPEATAEAIDADGWFHTGDIGEFQEGIFLKITDRKKEIFKTSGGKYIIPQAMENKFKESRFIEQIYVMGDGQKFPSALVVPNFAFALEWAKRKGIQEDLSTNEKIIANERIQKRIQKEVDLFNEGFGQWEKIKQFRLLAKEFSIDGGELTPTLKLKRKIILAKYQKEFDSIYAED
ncbi:MAG: long-chain fatty acid--CoA ligase [Crocinitomicaceae bacterium]